MPNYSVKPILGEGGSVVVDALPSTGTEGQVYVLRNSTLITPGMKFKVYVQIYNNTGSDVDDIIVSDDFTKENIEDAIYEKINLDPTDVPQWLNNLIDVPSVDTTQEFETRISQLTGVEIIKTEEELLALDMTNVNIVLQEIDDFGLADFVMYQKEIEGQACNLVLSINRLFFKTEIVDNNLLTDSVRFVSVEDNHIVLTDWEDTLSGIVTETLTDAYNSDKDYWDASNVGTTTMIHLTNIEPTYEYSYTEYLYDKGAYTELGGGSSVVANPELEGTEPELTGLEVEGGKYKVPEGTVVVANPELVGTEDELTGIQVGDTKYKVPQPTTVVANPTLAGTESELNGLQVGDTKYKNTKPIITEKAYTYVCAKKTWTSLPSGCYGHNVWTDGENIYFSSSSTQKVLDKATSTWSNKTWSGLTSFNGEYVWTDGDNIYCLNGSYQYVLDKATSTWSSKTWTVTPYNFDSRYIWTDGDNIYYSASSYQYVLDKANNTWETKSWNGYSSINGDCIWTDGTDIYYSNDNVQYKLNKDTSTWSSKSWTGLTRFYGYNIWTDGTNVYYSSSATQYVLSGTSAWASKPWSGLTSFAGKDVWTDGENIYYSGGSSSTQYSLNHATHTAGNLAIVAETGSYNDLKDKPVIPEPSPSGSTMYVHKCVLVVDSTTYKFSLVCSQSTAFTDVSTFGTYVASKGFVIPLFKVTNASMGYGAVGDAIMQDLFASNTCDIFSSGSYISFNESGHTFTITDTVTEA